MSPPGTLWFDISTVRARHGTPHGIPRVEAGLARAIAAIVPDARALWHDGDGLVAGTPEQLQTDDGRSAHQASFAPGRGWPPWATTELTASIPGVEELAPRSRLHLAGVLTTSMLPAPLGARIMATRQWLSDRRALRAPHAWIPAARDVVLVTGADWDRGVVGSLARTPLGHRPRLVVLIHDLLPAVRPELLGNDAAALRFTRWLGDVCHAADAVVTVSAATRTELEEYARARGWRCPPTEVVPPATELHLATSIRPERVPDGPYVVYVSTIERRKNHAVLVAAVRSAVSHGQPVPTVVFVGSWGWGIDDLRSELSRDRMLDGRVWVMNGLDDGRVRWVVEHARAAVIPSRYEGYGLPAAEARSLGVPILASDLPAHRESAGPTATLIDPYDSGAWRTALGALLDSEAPPHSAPAAPPRTWATAAAEVVNVIGGL